MTHSRTHSIAIIAGDGIGKEVIPAGLATIEAATRGTGISLTFTELPWGCDYYLRHGRMMDADGFERAASFDAIYLGAIGSLLLQIIAVWICCCHSGSVFSNTSTCGRCGCCRRRRRSRIGPAPISTWCAS
jgi:hypothetical protein